MVIFIFRNKQRYIKIILTIILSVHCKEGFDFVK